MAPSLSALPQGSTVLVTGANGFIASHVCDQLLSHGFNVRGTVRSTEKGEAIQRVLQARHSDSALSKTPCFSYVVVEEMSASGAFDTVMHDCSGVIHTAADTTFGTDAQRIIPRQVCGINNVLQSASQTPSIKRVVLTSSSNVLTPRPGTPGTVTDKSWNYEVLSKVWNISTLPEATRGAFVYAAAKTCVERAAWDFVDAKKPAFELNCVLPNFNIGLLLDPESPSRTTGSWIRDIFRDPSNIEGLRYFPPQYMVDVQDTAKLHLAALAEDDVKGERLLGFSAPFSFNVLLGVMSKLDPSRPWPEKIDGQLVDNRTIAKDRSVELLERFGLDGFTGIEESVKRCVYSG